MRDEKMRVWYAPEDMQGGKKLHAMIDEAIRVHDKLLLVLSEQSINSKWVATEIRRARRRERQEGKRVLFPIRVVPFEAIRDWELFDADEKELIWPPKSVNTSFRTFVTGRITTRLKRGFRRLLDDLKNESPTQTGMNPLSQAYARIIIGLTQRVRPIYHMDLSHVFHLRCSSQTTHVRGRNALHESTKVTIVTKGENRMLMPRTPNKWNRGSRFERRKVGLYTSRGPLKLSAKIRAISI